MIPSSKHSSMSVARDLRVLVHLRDQRPHLAPPRTARTCSRNIASSSERSVRGRLRWGVRVSVMITSSGEPCYRVARSSLDSGRPVPYHRDCDVRATRRATETRGQARPVRPAGGHGLARTRDQRTTTRWSGRLQWVFFWHRRRRGRRGCGSGSSGRRATPGGSWSGSSAAIRKRASRSPPAAARATSPHEDGLDRGADAYLLALPHGISATYAAQLRAAQPDAVVVDLSGDLRLPTAEAYQHWYGHDHPAPALLGGALRADRGLPRTASAARGWSRTPAATRPRCCCRCSRCCATGWSTPATSWWTPRAAPPAPAARRARTCCSREVADDFSAYAPGRAHRHVGEMEAVVRAGHGQGDRDDLLPAPAAREARDPVRALPEVERLRGRRWPASLREYYAGAPFVRVAEKPPRLSDVTGTNACRMSVHDAAPGPRGRVLRPRQPREGRGRPGGAEPEPRPRPARRRRACRRGAHDAPARVQGRRARPRGPGARAPPLAEDIRARRRARGARARRRARHRAACCARWASSRGSWTAGARRRPRRWRSWRWCCRASSTRRWPPGSPRPGLPAVGISGRDAGAARARACGRARPRRRAPTRVDARRAARAVGRRASLPVVSPVCGRPGRRVAERERRRGGAGHRASRCGASTLVYLSDVDGVRAGDTVARLARRGRGAAAHRRTARSRAAWR